jgi:hypothetical protein
MSTSKEPVTAATSDVPPIPEDSAVGSDLQYDTAEETQAGDDPDSAYGGQHSQVKHPVWTRAFLNTGRKMGGRTMSTVPLPSAILLDQN